MEIQAPTLGQWISELSSNLALEKLTYMARGKIETEAGLKYLKSAVSSFVSLILLVLGSLCSFPVLF